MKQHLDVMLRAIAMVGLVSISATAMSGTAAAQQKTARQCRDEWRANEAANKARGLTESAFVKECRAGTTTTAQPTSPPAAAPTAAPTRAAATQKTARQCRDEWRANEAANKARGLTESAFVKECRAGTTTAAQPTAPSAAAPAAAPATAAAGHKTARQCRDEWRANEAANKARGLTESAFVKDCRAGNTTATQAPASAPAAAPPPQRTASPAAPPPAPARTAPTVGSAPTGANQFADEARARAHCPSGLVVWVNTNSHVYHFSGHKDYGKTNEGAYMCEQDAMAAGDRAAKTEKHP